MNRDELREAYDKVRLSKRQSDRILENAQKAAAKRLNRFGRWTHVLSIAAVCMVVCVLFISGFGKDASSPQTGEAVSLNEELDDGVYELILYITNTETDDELRMLMTISIDTESKRIKLTPIVMDTFMKDPFRDGQPTKYRWMFTRYEAQQVTPVLAEELGMDTDNYVMMNLECLAQLIDYCGGLEIYISDEDIDSDQRNIALYTSDIDIIASMTEDIRYSAGIGVCDGISSLTWILCAETMREKELKAVREVYVINELMTGGVKGDAASLFSIPQEELGGSLEYKIDEMDLLKGVLEDIDTYKVNRSIRK